MTIIWQRTADLTYLQLHERPENTHLIFPIGHEIEASIGGFTPNNASGTHAVMHGTMKNNA